MSFVFDENLPPALARGMREFGEEARHLRELVAPGTTDEEWMERAEAESWTVVTHDHRIRFKRREVAAYRAHGIGAFFVLGKALSACAMIQIVVRQWPEMKRLARETKRPFIFLLPTHGSPPRRLPF